METMTTKKEIEFCVKKLIKLEEVREKIRENYKYVVEKTLTETNNWVFNIDNIKYITVEVARSIEEVYNITHELKLKAEDFNVVLDDNGLYVHIVDEVKAYIVDNKLHICYRDIYFKKELIMFPLI
jgi:hypothetical protein